MRNASVAIVPLILAIMLLFWFIAFMGGASDNLHNINNVEHLRHIQEKLLLSAIKYRYELQTEDPTLSEDELDSRVNDYINTMMQLNRIE